MAKELYQKQIIELARESRKRIRIDAPDTTIRFDNPLCGDRIDLDFSIEDGRISDIGFKVRGCALCEASSELLAQNANGYQLKELNTVGSKLSDYLVGDIDNPDWEGFEVFEPVKKVPPRHECVLLPFNAIKKAI
ncbi:MAG: iron-sulfur cluster assembly scaffold protein [Rhodospirillaceae bacterium]|nr:iron-sulfur cluster assembly scaffold protein [Rhodospirillaceae bacterium]